MAKIDLDASMALDVKRLMMLLPMGSIMANGLSISGADVGLCGFGMSSNEPFFHLCGMCGSTWDHRSSSHAYNGAAKESACNAMGRPGQLSEETPFIKGICKATVE